MKTNKGLAVWTYVLLFFLLFPFVIIFYASLSNSALISIPPKDLGLKAYESIFVEHRYVKSLWLSVQLACVSTALALVLGTAASLVLVRKRDHILMKITSTIMMAPLIIPLVIVGIALLIILNKLAIPLNFGTLTLVHLVILLPYVIRTISASLEGLDPRIEEAALNLGAGPWRTLLEITIPQLKSGLFTGGMLAFITSFGETIVTVFILPPTKLTLPVDIFNTLVYNFSPSIAAISALVSIGVFLLIWFVFLLFPNMLLNGNKE